MRRRIWPLPADLAPKESNFPDSQTVPDQTMSLRELLDRHTRGMSVPGLSDPIFDEDSPLPDIRTMDLAEIHDMIQENKMKLDEYRKKSEKAELEKQKAKEKAGIIEEYEKTRKQPTESSDFSPPRREGLNVDTGDSVVNRSNTKT